MSAVVAGSTGLVKRAHCEASCDSTTTAACEVFRECDGKFMHSVGGNDSRKKLASG